MGNCWCALRLGNSRRNVHRGRLPEGYFRLRFFSRRRSFRLTQALARTGEPSRAPTVPAGRSALSVAVPVTLAPLLDCLAVPATPGPCRSSRLGQLRLEYVSADPHIVRADPAVDVAAAGVDALVLHHEVLAVDLALDQRRQSVAGGAANTVSSRPSDR